MADRSNADAFISAVTRIGLMEDGISNEHPLRHTVRTLKRTAELILSNASWEAEGLAWAAINLVSDYEKERAAAAIGEQGVGDE